MRTESIERRIAYFISPHGFGHASRSSAVMEAVCERSADIRFEIFTQVPEWFFHQSLTRAFGYHKLQTDLGLVQKSPLVFDLDETLRRLDEILPFDERLIESLARQVSEMRSELIVCDIAPMGIAVAGHARLPSILIENFTWDWIYEEYVRERPRIQAHADYLRAVFGRAQYHIQLEPVSVPRADATLRTPPVSREPRTPRAIVRERLGVPVEAKTVLISMGGVPSEFPFLEHLTAARHVFFVVPGGSQTHEVRDNLVLLPHASEFYHPDLVNAADIVVGKIGYSTVAEAYHAGVPLAYVMRSSFRESPALAEFADRELHGRAISADDFALGNWLTILDEMLLQSNALEHRPNGAQLVADFLVRLLNKKNRES